MGKGNGHLRQRRHCEIRSRFSGQITPLLCAQVDPRTVPYMAGHGSSKTAMDIYAKVKYNESQEPAAVVNGASGHCQD